MATVTLRNVTGSGLAGEYPGGGQFDLPPGARATFTWDDTGLAKDSVEVACAAQYPGRVEYLLGLGCVEEGLAEGALPDLPEQEPLGEVDEDGVPIDDPKSELNRALDADEDD